MSCKNTGKHDSWGGGNGEGKRSLLMKSLLNCKFLHLLKMHVLFSYLELAKGSEFLTLEGKNRVVPVPLAASLVQRLTLKELHATLFWCSWLFTNHSQ